MQVTKVKIPEDVGVQAVNVLELALACSSTRFLDYPQLVESIVSKGYCLNHSYQWDDRSLPMCAFQDTFASDLAEVSVPENFLDYAKELQQSKFFSSAILKVCTSFSINFSSLVSINASLLLGCILAWLYWIYVNEFESDIYMMNEFLRENIDLSKIKNFDYVVEYIPIINYNNISDLFSECDIQQYRQIAFGKDADLFGFRFKFENGFLKCSTSIGKTRLREFDPNLVVERYNHKSDMSR